MRRQRTKENKGGKVQKVQKETAEEMYSTESTVHGAREQNNMKDEDI